MIYILQSAVEYFASFLEIVIFVRVIISWLPIGRDSAVLRLLYMLSEPVLGPIRSAIRKSPLGGPGMSLDFSPILAYIFVELAKTVLIALIGQIGLMIVK